MNTNDLPPAAKLAALIEAGRAAHPELKHGRGSYLRGGEACALGFAALACGVQQQSLIDSYPFTDDLVKTPFIKHIGMTYRTGNLLGLVADHNDCGETLEEICQSLREGELAKLPA